MKIKQFPEDFIVEEISKLKVSKEKQDYSVIKLKKKNWGAFEIVQVLSKKLKINQKSVGFAGNKDKKAITTQYFSLFKVSKEKIGSIKLKDVEISFIGYSKNRINLGDLKGNNFKIIIREIKNKKILSSMQLENYFDEQRFGNKLNTHLVGKAIIQKDFKKACELLNQSPGNDPIGTLRLQPRRLLRFYIAAYQSYLWNKNLARILSKNKNISRVKYPFGELVFTRAKIKNFKLPLVNFDIKENKELKQILKEEKIKKEDFIIRQLPELVTDSQERDAFIEVKNIKKKWKDDILELEFFLPKGSYATMLIKKLDPQSF